MNENEKEKKKIKGKFSDWEVSPLMINNDLELLLKIFLVWLIAGNINWINSYLMQKNLLTPFPRKFISSS